MASRLYAGNLPWTCTEDDLRQLFHDFHVSDVKIISDRETGRSRGFGFVTLGSEKEAQDAIAEFDGQDFGGRTLRLREANERPDASRENRRRSGRRDSYGWNK
jgi:cold-inducible RNA-binding protein